MKKFLMGELTAMKENALEILAEKTGASTAKLSKEQKISFLVSKAFVSNPGAGKFLAAAFSEVTGSKITYTQGKASSFMPPRGSVLKVIMSYNPFIPGELVLFIGKNSSANVMRTDRDMRYALPIGQATDEGTYWQYASAEEIDAFFKTLEPPRKEGSPDVDAILNSI